MKKIITLLIISAFFISSCGTISYKKCIYLVDAPKDVEVLKDNVPLKVSNLVLGSYESGHTRYVYHYPGFMTKINKKPFKIVVKAGDQSGEVTINSKRGVKLLIVEGLFTCGVFTVIDLLTGGDRSPLPKFIDVPAVISNEKQRSDKELKKAAYDSFR